MNCQHTLTNPKANKAISDFIAEKIRVKGGAMKDHRGGEKLYHLAPLCSIDVSANC